MAKREVISAKLHQAGFVVGIGDLTTTLPPTGRTMLKLYMTTCPEGIEAKATIAGKEYEFIVPWANVVTAEYAPLKDKK